MTPNKWQLKAAVTGKVTSGSDWDGKSLGEIYLTLRKQGATNRGALEVVAAIKDNRLYVQTTSPYRHIGPDQAFAWLVESGISPYTAARRVWGYSIPKDVWQAIEAVASKLNAEHQQALEDARMAA